MTATGGKHTPNVVTWQTLELFNQTGKKNFGFFFIGGSSYIICTKRVL